MEINIDEVAKTNPYVKLMRAIFPETDEDKLFRTEKIHRWYYCTHPELIKLGVYRLNGVPKRKEGYTSVAQLFHLGISDNPSLDWFGKDRDYLEVVIREGLGMCSHCKFYEKKMI